VEWDNKLGSREIQRVSTSVNLGANEVQIIETDTAVINEVQLVTTSTNPVHEVQEIVLSPPPGHLAPSSMMTYSLLLDTSLAGGSFQYSGRISATATASDGRNSVQEIIESMANVENGVVVTKSSDDNPDGGHTYSVTFPLSMKNVPLMEVYVSDLPVKIISVEDGNALGGTFRLSYEGETTESISFDASSSEVKNKLEKLSSIGTVNVYRGPPDEQNGYSWEVQFISHLNHGNIESLEAFGDGLYTTNPIGLSNVKVETITDGSYIGGTFRLQFGMWL